MKLHIDPLPAKKAQAIAKIDLGYQSNYDRKIIAYGEKRTLATLAKSGQIVQEFVDAAAIENMDVDSFADLILSKTNVIMDLENRRRAHVMRVKVATSLDEVDTIVGEYSNG